MSVFAPAEDFLGMVQECGFPGSVTVQQINVDSWNVTATAYNVPAIGRTTDATAMGVTAAGNVITKGKRFWLLASAITFGGLKIRDAVLDTGDVTREITAVDLVGFDTVYRVETHAVPTS